MKPTLTIFVLTITVSLQVSASGYPIGDPRLSDLEMVMHYAKDNGENLKAAFYQQGYFNANTSHVEIELARYTGEEKKASVSASFPQAQFLEATQPCPPEVATWWQEVRTTAKEVINAQQRKSQALRAWSQAHPPGSGNYSLPKKERDKLESDITNAIERYRQVLSEGRAKSYRAPIKDSARPFILYMGVAGSTEQARKNKTNGTVNLQVEFRDDGLIGEVKVVSGLKDGLDEQAIQAIRRTIFLPSVKDGVFVTVTQMSQTEFNIR
jgi:TonB family protein